MKLTKKYMEMAIEQIKEFGEIYVGDKNIWGTLEVCKAYNKLEKAVEKELPGNVLAFNLETGYAWLV